jgi:accessory colonization factor AcfC
VRDPIQRPLPRRSALPGLAATPLAFAVARAQPAGPVRAFGPGGPGQVAMGEDVAGRTGDGRLVRAMRERIVPTAPDTGAAQAAGRDRPGDFDAWPVWNTWRVAAPEHAAPVDIEEPFSTWRSVGTMLARRGVGRPEVRRFADFLSGPEGAAIFRRFSRAD